MTLYFSAVQTHSGESGNTLDNQVQWYDRRESKHLSEPQRPKPSAVAKVRWATLCLTLTKQAFRKDDSVARKLTILAHSTAKEKPRRNLRGDATNGSRSLSFKITSKGIMNGKSPYQAKVRHSKAKSPYTQDPSEESKKYIINYAFEREK